MSIPTLTVEALLNGSWVDISAWVELSDPLIIVRGRASEQATADAGTCEFDLINDDGRFTVGNASSPYYPYWRKWIQVRATQFGSRRYTGYISALVESWPEDPENSSLARVHVTCTDVIGMMAKAPASTSWCYTLMDSILNNAWWALNDPSGSTVAYPELPGMFGTVPNLVANAYPYTYSIPELLSFGAEGIPSMESDTGVVFTPFRGHDDLAATYAGLTSASAMPAMFFGGAKSCTFYALYLPPNVGSYEESVQTIFCIYQDAAHPILVVTRQGATMVAYCYNSSATLTATMTVAGVFTRGVPTLLAFGVYGTGGSGDTITWVPTGYTMTAAGITAITGGYMLRLGVDNSGIHPLTGTLFHVGRGPSITTDAYNELVAKLLGVGVGNVTAWLGRALEVSGLGTITPATWGLDREIGRPNLKGSNPADIGSALATSCGGMWIADRDGVPTWIDPAYCPARVDFDASLPNLNSLQRTADQSLYYTQVTVDGTVRATIAGFPVTAYDIPGLLSEPTLTNYVTYLANIADVEQDPRLTGITFDLATVDATVQAAALGLDLRSRFYLPTPPLPQVSQPMVMTVEGYTETIGVATWTLAINTAPDPRFVVGDTVAGVVGSDYRLCAF